MSIGALTTPNLLPNHNNQVVPNTHATPTEPPAAAELSVDEDGKICYYGPTSAVHEPSRMDTPASPVASAATARASATGERARSSLAALARESRTWEEFALGNASLQTGIPRQLMAKLLHIHWAWISPMFMWVYRPAFVCTFSNTNNR